MAEMSPDYAAQKLANELPTMQLDDLVVVYNELFPFEPITEDEGRQKQSEVFDRITEHFKRGLHLEEIVALWNVVFTKDYNVYYNEETRMIHYNEEPDYYFSE